jgi:hypothetical protein
MQPLKLDFNDLNMVPDIQDYQALEANFDEL